MKEHSILDISIYQIQLFLTVAKECSFSRASDIMHITQPTLSKRIRGMEEIIGVELFDRKKRPLELTPAGAALYGTLHQFSEKIESLMSSVRNEHGNDVMRFSVGLCDSGKQMPFFHKAGKSLQAETEGLTFSWQYVQVDKWREMLNNGSIDIAMMLRLEEPYLEGYLQWERIMEVPKLVCMLKTNPLSEKESISYEDLRSQRFVMNSIKVFPAYYEFVRAQTMKYGGFEPIIARFAQNPNDLIANLEFDDEVVVCDMYLRDVDSDFLKCFELPDTKSGLDAIWRKDNYSPYIQRYLEHTRKYLAELYPEAVVF